MTSGIKQSSGLWLFIITGVLGYIHKVPLLSKLFSIITFWYGKTTFNGLALQGPKVEASSSHATVSDKLFSVPNTPKTSPKLPIIEVTDWENADRSHSPSDVHDSLKRWKIKYNKLPYNVVTKENIDN